MSLHERIENLSATLLPIDLLTLLFKARQLRNQGQIERAYSMINIIEDVCRKRDIKIQNHRNAPHYSLYQPTVLPKGQFVDLYV
jgi:hypothetical protein